ncbi:hypothetical protein RJ641_022791 [Dillenia turbinata]|uniref:Uncharacterized protein n=1 Tax=Dillenia turbinata TaxID=194707 RepID=A0AAN8UD66_9MAGN
MVNFTSKDTETKMHTAKINQGNIALKMNFFEDAKSKILMILCESPYPKELHKPISTLEYGAKAKGIVYGTQTPVKDKDDIHLTRANGLFLGSSDEVEVCLFASIPEVCLFVSIPNYSVLLSEVGKCKGSSLV